MSPCWSAYCAAIATLFTKQKPEDRALLAWCPGGRHKTNPRCKPSSDSISSMPCKTPPVACLAASRLPAVTYVSSDETSSSTRTSCLGPFMHTGPCGTNCGLPDLAAKDANLANPAIWLSSWTSWSSESVALLGGSFFSKDQRDLFERRRSPQLRTLLAPSGWPGTGPWSEGPSSEGPSDTWWHATKARHEGSAAFAFCLAFRAMDILKYHVQTYSSDWKKLYL